MTACRMVGLWLAILMAMFSVACGGSSVAPNPPGPGPDFSRMSATVTDAAGQALPGLSVRVDGQPTGVTTDSLGRFELTSSAFPKGVDQRVEIALGRSGIVLGTREVVPTQNPVLDIRLGETGGAGTASLSGTVYNGNLAVPMLGVPGMEANFPAAATLDGVEITLFNASAGAVFQTVTRNGGQFSFEGVGSGGWQISALFEGYYPEMGALRIEEGSSNTYDFMLIAKGQVAPGEGVAVSGVLRDSLSGQPIGGATVNMYADTGYVGIMPVPEPFPGDPNSGWGSTEPAVPGGEPGKGPSFAPDIYRPQYQTTTSAADGSFSFPQEVAGYSLWLDFSADGYLAGTHYADIQGRSGSLSLELELLPVIPTGVHGRVVNGSGAPVKGARVEFIFGNGFMNGPAVPGFASFEDMANQGGANFDSIGAPPPGMPAPPSNSGSPDGWDDKAEAPAAGGDAASPGGSNGSGFNNPMMQRFLWEQQQKGSSAVPADFNGYVVTYTDDNGDYNFSDIPAGPYYVMVSAYRHLPFAGEAVLDDTELDNVLDVTLPVVPVGSVEGVVKDEDGTVLVDVLVNATQPNVDPFAYTGADGRYRIDNVPAGEWLVSGFKSGYYSASQTIEIAENGVAVVNLTLRRYSGPAASTIAFGGRVYNGFDNGNVSGADIVFTPIEEQLGGYARHILSGTDGSYSTTLVPQTDYNVLIQKTGFEDIFFRFWIDEFSPRMDFWLWPIGAPGGQGGWNGGGRPMPGTDPAGPNTGVTQPRG